MTKTVVRHPLIVRLIHWTVALSGIALLFTGFGEMPMYKRYGVASIPGLGWSQNFELNLVLHYLFAALFMAAVMFHIVFHYRRNEMECMPKKGDVAESVHIVKAMLTGKEEPPHGKFLAEQRLAYLAIGVATLVLIVTGFIKTYKNTGPVTFDPQFMFYVTMTHTMASMLFMFLLFAHVGAFLLKANWPLLPSMFTGKVSAEYAQKRHPLWKVK